MKTELKTEKQRVWNLRVLVVALLVVVASLLVYIYNIETKLVEVSKYYAKYKETLAQLDDAEKRADYYENSIVKGTCLPHLGVKGDNNGN